MKFPQANHRPTTDPIPKTVESNAKLVEEYLEKVDWKKFIRTYWYIVGSVLATVMLFIVGVGIAHKIVSLL